MPYSPLHSSPHLHSLDELSVSELQQKLHDIKLFLHSLSQCPEALLPLQLQAKPNEGDRLLTQARQGDASAQYQLALDYLKAKQRPLSLCHAACWFQLASLQKHPKATKALELLKTKLTASQWQQAQYLAAERQENNL